MGALYFRCWGLGDCRAHLQLRHLLSLCVLCPSSEETVSGSSVPEQHRTGDAGAGHVLSDALGSSKDCSEWRLRST